MNGSICLIIFTASHCLFFSSSTACKLFFACYNCYACCHNFDHLIRVDSPLQIHTMLHGLSEEEFGPQIHFREYSFLQNPSVPKHVKILLYQYAILSSSYSFSVAHTYISIPITFFYYGFRWRNHYLMFNFVMHIPKDAIYPMEQLAVVSSNFPEIALSRWYIHLMIKFWFCNGLRS